MFYDPAYKIHEVVESTLNALDISAIQFQCWSPHIGAVPVTIKFWDGRGWHETWNIYDEYICNGVRFFGTQVWVSFFNHMINDRELRYGTLWQDTGSVQTLR